MVAYAFRAFGRVDFINQRPHVNGCIRAFRFADIAVNAFVGDHQGHVETSGFAVGLHETVHAG